MVAWLRRLLNMPDRERARTLAVVLGTGIIALLYLLGAASLFVRCTYLQTTPGATAPVATVTEQACTATPASTLFPTITPRP